MPENDLTQMCSKKLLNSYSSPFRPKVHRGLGIEIDES